jgi:hypothetical protein
MCRSAGDGEPVARPTSEYVPWFIKTHRPELIERFNIPLDEYIARSEKAAADAWDVPATHERSNE